MDFLSLETTEAIGDTIENIFDKVGLDFLGLIPTISRTKKIIFDTSRSNLVSIFLQALGTRDPNKSEEESLKYLLSVSNGYIEALKEKTKTKTIQAMNNYTADARSSGFEPSTNALMNIFTEEIDKAKSGLQVIVNSESKSCKNVAMGLQISRVAESQGIARPVVYFIVTLDDRTAKEPEQTLHLIPGTKIPRLWFLDELASSYWSKGMTVPSIHGGHPNCRCVLTTLMQDWGFGENGRIQFKGIGYNALEEQRLLYPL